MKVKMSEVFQGRDVSAKLLPGNSQVSALEKDCEYEVSAVLGSWLIENGKAVLIVEAKPEPVSEESETVKEYQEVPEQPRLNKRGR